MAGVAGFESLLARARYDQVCLACRSLRELPPLFGRRSWLFESALPHPQNKKDSVAVLIFVAGVLGPD
ncbi:hypothetical protein DID80_04890 [Candidatus Marinamargulisbacteria bacterium SCGC AAA071-K20]|nr:hypothetical protein DID80_04890 [Candidatus Marinamargulisbacteria bacterium SCGC AAA071-K20]